MHHAQILKTTGKKNLKRRKKEVNTLEIGRKQSTADGSSFTLEESGKVLQCLKRRNCQPRFLYMSKISLSNQGETDTLSETRKLRKIVTNRNILKNDKKKTL